MTKFYRRPLWFGHLERIKKVSKVHGSETYSEPYQTSMIEGFVKTVSNYCKLLHLRCLTGFLGVRVISKDDQGKSRLKLEERILKSGKSGLS